MDGLVIGDGEQSVLTTIESRSANPDPSASLKNDGQSHIRTTNRMSAPNGGARRASDTIEMEVLASTDGLVIDDGEQSVLTVTNPHL